MHKNLMRAALVMACAVFLSGLFLNAAPAITASADTGANWNAQYWPNTTFSGNVAVTRTDPTINFNWGTSAPDPALAPHNFSVRWTLTLAFAGGFVNFRAGCEGGVRVYIDGNILIDQWHDTTNFANYIGPANLGAGNHTLTVEYFSASGLSGVIFDWSGGSSTNATAIPITSIPVTPIITLKAEVRVSIANVRADPSTNNPPIGQIYFGDIYKVIAGNPDGTWYLLRLSDGSQGWVFRRTIYLFNGTTDTLPITQATLAPPGVLADVEAVATINLIVRDGPSRRNTTKKIGALNQGESFKVIALSRNHAWVQIEASGNLKGWVFVPYINVTVGNLGALPVHN